MVQRVLKKQSKKKKIFLEKKTKNEKLATWPSLIESLKLHFRNLLCNQVDIYFKINLHFTQKKDTI